MNTKWTLPFFSLDTSRLWEVPDAPQPTAVSPAFLNECDQKLREKLKGDVGFYDYPAMLRDKPPGAVLAAVERLRSDYEAALVLGIGGSYLGAGAAVAAVGQDAFPLTWVSNIDPSAIRTAERRLRGRRHALVVISKSGNTTETLAAFYHFSRSLDPKGWVIITDPKHGELRALAHQNGWTSLEIPPNIGGRFSVLTPVGLVPAGLGDVDLQGLVVGANAMRTALESTPVEENPAYHLAMALHLWDRQGCHEQYLMPYWSSLRLFAEWYVQLWGESLGKLDKSGRRQGPTAVAALGTTDQHSLLQLFTQGPRNKVVGLIDVCRQGESTPVSSAAFEPGAGRYLTRHTFEKISTEACRATEQSLTNSKVATYRIEVPELNAAAMGALFFFFEAAVAFAGELYQVNAFDQPGVEEAKRLLHAALK